RPDARPGSAFAMGKYESHSQLRKRHDERPTTRACGTAPEIKTDVSVQTGLTVSFVRFILVAKRGQHEPAPTATDPAGAQRRHGGAPARGNHRPSARSRALPHVDDRHRRARGRLTRGAD